MKTAICFASKHGTTEKVAHILEHSMEGDITLFDLHENKNPDLSAFDTVIIGSSVHIGSVQSEVKKLLKEKHTLLLQKKLGLYLCHGSEGEEAKQEFDNNYPEDLRNHATALGLFGGEFLLEKMNWFERFIVKKMAKISESESRLKEDAIEEFVRKMG